MSDQVSSVAPSDPETVASPLMTDDTPTAGRPLVVEVEPATDPERTDPGPPPWPGSTPGGSQGTPPAPPSPPSTPGRSGSWRQFVAGALVGAVVGAATAGGITLATDDGGSVTRTVVVRPQSDPTRNTSVIAQPRDIQGILAAVEPAVVAIRTGAATDEGLFSDGGGQGGAGTGFVISADGVVVTNNHVVEGSGGRIQVAFSDGTSLPANVLGRSPENDLAVLKVEGANLPVAKLGSSDALAVGDEVVAIGNALALEGGLSVTRGIISAKSRTVPEQNGVTLFDMLQTDAAINPGNSGGPLVSSKGEVVGINTALAGGSQNVGFAISIDQAKQVIDDLRAGKEVRTAFLGVETQAVTSAIAEEQNLVTKRGALIMRVSNGSGAADAGLKAGDVIVAIDGTDITRPDDVAAEVRRNQPGDQAEVTIERNGAQRTVTVTLGTRPSGSG